MTSPTDDITAWLGDLQQGQPNALQPLWERYYQRLVELAGRRLPRNGATSESEIASSAFHSFYRGMIAGRFPHVTDRHNFWRLLVHITGRKIADHLEHTNALKRGREFTRADAAALECVIGREPSPDFAAAVAEQWQVWIDALNRDNLGQIAQWKMEGYTNAEIAGFAACSLRTVTNKLDLIRKILEVELHR